MTYVLLSVVVFLVQLLPVVSMFFFVIGDREAAFYCLALEVGLFAMFYVQASIVEVEE